jgi:hypothetical protein
MGRLLARGRKPRIANSMAVNSMAQIRVHRRVARSTTSNPGRRSLGNHSTDSRSTDSHSTDSRSTGSHSLGSHNLGNHNMGSRSTGSHNLDNRSMGSRSTGSQLRRSSMSRLRQRVHPRRGCTR